MRDRHAPPGAPIAKVAACRAYGATLIEGGESLDEAVVAAQDSGRRCRHGVLPPRTADHVAVVAGSGRRVGLGFARATSLICAGSIVPLGAGGGLAAGVAIAVKTAAVPEVQRDRRAGRGRAVREPTRHRQDLWSPLRRWHRRQAPGELTCPLVEHWLDDIVAADEDAVADAMILLMERAKFYVEARRRMWVAAACWRTRRPGRHRHDVRRAQWWQRRSRRGAGADPSPRDHGRPTRWIVFARISDRPGGLARLLTTFAEQGANLIEVEHCARASTSTPRRPACAVLEVRGRGHAAPVLAAARAAGYDVHEVAHRALDVRDANLPHQTSSSVSSVAMKTFISSVVAAEDGHACARGRGRPA